MLAWHQETLACVVAKLSGWPLALEELNKSWSKLQGENGFVFGCKFLPSPDLDGNEKFAGVNILRGCVPGKGIHTEAASEGGRLGMQRLSLCSTQAMSDKSFEINGGEKWVFKNKLNLEGIMKCVCVRAQITK